VPMTRDIWHGISIVWFLGLLAVLTVLLFVP
jgi:hypothetical protein